MLYPPEEPGGMTWQEVKDFLDHIRTTGMDERQEFKLEVRRLLRAVRRVDQKYGPFEDFQYWRERS